MTDIFTPEKRSEIMSHIRSKWTAPEVKIHSHLKGRKVRHMMHPSLEGSPDIELLDAKTAVFIHGCFWHKCPKCYREPKSNTEYWIPKLERIVKRDMKNARSLRKQGYSVVRIWEHQIKRDFKGAMRRLVQ